MDVFHRVAAGAARRWRAVLPGRRDAGNRTIPGEPADADDAVRLRARVRRPQGLLPVPHGGRVRRRVPWRRRAPARARTQPAAVDDVPAAVHAERTHYLAPVRWPSAVG